MNVYESLHCKLTCATRRQIADLIMTKNTAILVTNKNVQWQNGGNNCGVFAVAFAASLCMGQDPASVVYDQPRMRRHLLSCII